MNERSPADAINLERRAAPQQRRSQARIALIVKATKHLLERGEADSVTTTRVAAEAGVPVSSVYRYFPNIYAIHRAILEEFQAELDCVIDHMLSEANERDWRDSLSDMIIALRRLVVDNPSYGAVFRLTLTSPELRTVREAWNLRLANVLAERWRQGMDGFHGDHPDHVARMAVEIYCASEILIFEKRDTPEDADIYFAETLMALQRYLEPYLD